MFIRRKVYSVIKDENGEQRLFSTTEVKSDEKPKKNKIASQESYRGNLRAYLVGGGAGIAGRAVGNKVMTKAARKGKSDEEVEKAGKKAATITGAVGGAGLGGVVAANGIEDVLKKSGNSTKDLGIAAQKAAGKAARKLKLGKNVTKAIGGANNTKVGKAVKVGLIASGAAANAGLGALGARLGAKKAFKERKEKADTERFGE